MQESTQSLVEVEQKEPNGRELFLRLLNEVKTQTRERYLQRLKRSYNLPSTDENRPLTFEELFENNEDMMAQMRQRVDEICQQLADKIAQRTDEELVQQFVAERLTKATPDQSFKDWLKNSMAQVLSEMPEVEAEAAEKMSVGVLLIERADSLLSLRNLKLLPWVLALQDDKIIDLGEKKIGGTIRNKSDLAEIFEQALDQGKPLPVVEKPTQSKLGGRLGKIFRGRSAASGSTESTIAIDDVGETEPNSHDLAVQLADRFISELIKADVSEAFSTQLAGTIDELLRENRPDIIQAERARADEEAIREFFSPAEKYGSLELTGARDCDQLYDEIIKGLDYPLEATYTNTHIPYFSITLWNEEFVRILVPPFFLTSQDKRLTLVFTSSDVSAESISSFGAPVLANIIKSHVTTTDTGSAQ